MSLNVPHIGNYSNCRANTDKMAEKCLSNAQNIQTKVLAKIDAYKPTQTDQLPLDILNYRSYSTRSEKRLRKSNTAIFRAAIAKFKNIIDSINEFERTLKSKEEDNDNLSDGCIENDPKYSDDARSTDSSEESDSDVKPLKNKQKKTVAVRKEEDKARRTKTEKAQNKTFRDEQIKKKIKDLKFKFDSLLRARTQKEASRIRKDKNKEALNALINFTAPKIKNDLTQEENKAFSFQIDATINEIKAALDLYAKEPVEDTTA